MVSYVAHPRHEGADGSVINAWVFVRPVVFIAKTPENDGRVIEVLFDHVRQHVFRILLKGGIADTGTAPGSFLPHHQTELVTQIEYQAILLVVGEANKVRTHVANQAHLFPDLVVAHRCGNAGVVGMPVCSLQENAFAVEFEWPVLYEFDVPYAEALLH